MGITKKKVHPGDLIRIKKGFFSMCVSDEILLVLKASRIKRKLSYSALKSNGEIVNILDSHIGEVLKL